MQTANIDMSSVTSGWMGLGHYKASKVDNKLKAFLGSYDGQGYTISNFVLDQNTFASADANCYRGAFINFASSDKVPGGPVPVDATPLLTIKNLIIENVSWTDAAKSGEHGCAAFFGMARGVTVENCLAKGLNNDNDHRCAGIVVQLQGNSILRNCTNEMTIATSAKKPTGGICGFIQGPEAVGILFDGCVNNGSVTCGTDTTYNQIGGICGNVGSGAGQGTVRFNNCVNTGTIGQAGGQIIGSPASTVSTLADQPQPPFALGSNVVLDGKIAIATTDTKAFYDGLWFADKDAINDGKATLISTNDLVEGGTYKAFAKFTAGPVFTLAAEDDTIAFDLSLVGDDASFITVGAGAGLKAEASAVTDHVVTFTAVKDLANYTVTLSYSDTEIKSATINEAAWEGTPQEFVEGTAITVAAVAQEGYENVTYKIGDETITGGAFTLASNTVVTVTATQAGGKDWPTDPEDPVVKGKTAAEAFPGKVPTALANVPAANFAAWAIKAGIDFANPGEINVDAYLLDCKPSEVETEKANFKITKIEFVNGEWVVTVTGDKTDEQDYNANAKVEIVDITDEFDEALTEKTDAKGFFKAELKAITLTK